ncbi:outer membrane-stress sensor serine endopeptidase DegS [Aliivibrio finisterrensis]|uniref:Serine endoprotease DegS n=1 Tax=Aliivibrio finisterrensis TaxID=511998 RepID=A0A6N6RSC9_9GAMM|nr:outer membrane-stress sensor serine endopeptidase DegS [Aliivibrio finisterrensis]KAB2824337.1 outer membrane-stress sensor serine endopeptidase DegS [Aliivibrio finisterrensis]
MLSFLLRSAIIGTATAAVLLFAFPNLRSSITTEQLQANQAPQQISNQISFNYAVRRAAPAVVNIYSRKYNDEDRLRLDTEGLGSGVIVSDKGYIITNYHVVADADQVIVALQDGRLFNSQLIGKDKRTDLAVLQIKDANLPVIPLNPNYQADIGDVVLAIGNPYNLGQTTTFGIISATGRAALNADRTQGLIQTDAAINRGNSGGALVNTRGELVGINTASFQQATELETYGISFAIPYALADKIMRRLIADGQVIRGYIGIDGRDINPAMARLMNADNINGILVLGVAPNSPAEKAGIITQDIITSIDGKSIINRQNVTDIVTELRPETEVDVDVIRKGKPQTIKVTIAEDPSN